MRSPQAAAGPSEFRAGQGLPAAPGTGTGAPGSGSWRETGMLIIFVKNIKACDHCQRKMDLFSHIFWYIRTGKETMRKRQALFHAKR
jgi:hypothetical protein